MLAYPKFKLTKTERLLLLADLLPYAETVTSLEVPLDLPVIRDQADQKFITLAVAGNADALVTGDNDLLVMKDLLKNSPIISLSEFEQWQNN